MELIDLLVFLVFAAVALFNMLRGKRRRPSPPAPEPVQQHADSAPPTHAPVAVPVPLRGRVPVPAPVAEVLLDEEEVWGRDPVRAEPVVVVPALPVAPREQRQGPLRVPVAVSARRVGHGQFRGRGALRHAVLAMTVLGPCRALAPYEDGTGPSNPISAPRP